MIKGSVFLIDGGYLKVLLKNSFGEPRIDFAKFSSVIACDGESKLIRTYYYYCLPFLSSSPSDEDRKRHDAAQIVSLK